MRCGPTTETEKHRSTQISVFMLRTSGLMAFILKISRQLQLTLLFIDLVRQGFELRILAHVGQAFC